LCRHRLTTLETAPLRSDPTCPVLGCHGFCIYLAKIAPPKGRGKGYCNDRPRRSFGTTGQAACWEVAAACLANGPFRPNKAIKPPEMSGSGEWPNDGVLHDSFGVTIFADQAQKPRQPCGRGKFVSSRLVRRKVLA